MSLTTAQELGLVPQIPPMGQRFTLANGAEVQSLFQATASCSFPRAHARQQPKECVFHIFSTLAVPAIMGTEFVSSTQVFTTRRSELIVEEVTSTELLSVNFLGSPRNSLVCRLQTQVACAIVDTGSDLNLVSSEFARKLVDLVVPNHEKLQLADGSFDFTVGLITVDFSIGDIDEAYRFLARGGEARLDFHVLESLGTDVLIGLDTVEDFAVFQNHTKSFIPSISHNGIGNANILRHVGRVENWIVEQFRRLRAGPAGGSNNVSATSENLDVQQQRENSRRERDGLDLVNSRPRGNLSGFISQSPPSNISALPLNCPPSFHLGSSDTSRSFTPETDKASTPLSSRLPADELTNPEAGYRCTFKGCTAAPFKMQYLLERGCPRSEGGKGFKLKNEMIRHGLVHDYPGYCCPFCPDREHKFPRPSILERHVRVHHVDKSENDPLLREVLSQRPDGPIRGRKPRGGPP
ncbi:hypothetical protein K456DRAFT_1749530 [Colletotrichum gloeosporioides 23]|nr:hypothetical protein K456DRAFT_1749530 [Colletotrichum gloeosporioides 23]